MGLTEGKPPPGIEPAEPLLVRFDRFSIRAKEGHRRRHRATLSSVHSSCLVQVAARGRTPKELVVPGTEGTWCADSAWCSEGVHAPKVLGALKVLAVLKVLGVLKELAVPRVPGAPKEIGAPRLPRRR